MYKKTFYLSLLCTVLVFSLVLGCKSSDSDDDSTSVQQFTGMVLEGLTNNGTTTQRTAIVNTAVPNPNSTSTTTYNGEVRVYVNNQYVLAYPEYSGTAWVIERSISLNAGANTIYVSVYYQGNEFARSNTFKVTGDFPQVPWRFELTWNTNGNDLDLHLVKDDGWTDPNKHCFYFNKEIPDIAKLDYDDTNGFGPENISIEQNAPSGSYKIYVKYFSAESVTGPVIATVKIFQNGTLKETKTHTFTVDDESYDDESYEADKDWYVYEVVIP